MRILFLNHNTMWRGTYVRCFNFARHLARFGHEVTILTSTPDYILRPVEETIEGVRVARMPDVLGRRFRNGGLGPVDTLLRCLYVLRRPFDVLESYDHRPNVLYPALAGTYLAGVPLVSEWTDLHGTGGTLSERPKWVQALIGGYENFTEQNSKKLARHLVVISRGLGRRAEGLGIPPERITYIPGGADVENILPLDKGEARDRLGLPRDRKIIAYTGYSHYDMDMLVAALARVLEARKDVMVVTTGGTLPERAKSRLPEPGRLLELGFVPYETYVALLPAVDLFVFPFLNRSVNTGRWPNKIGDYMAAGRPTVSNRTGDMVELFEERRIGLLAADDERDVAEKILTVLGDEALARELGQNARETAERIYDWKLLSMKLEKCLARASGLSPAPAGGTAAPSSV